MPRARPIPRGMLIHSATHQYGTIVNDANGNPTWPSTRALGNVRFEPTGRLVIDRGVSKQNQEIRLSLLMFYDETNSTPSGVTFAFGDKIVWNGFPYRVSNIDLLYDGERLHHKEIGLI